MTDEFANLDVSKFSYEEWLEFFFDRRILGEHEYFPEAFCPEYDDFEVFDPSRVIAYLRRLFTEFREVGKQHTLRQINQGIWAIFGGAMFDLQQCLWAPSVPLKARLGCIHAMRHPYADFLAGHPAEVMENCFYMWWDFIGKSFWRRGSLPYYARLDDEHKALLDAMLETLCAILELPDARCQSSALHGLGHLHHPGARDVVQRFIDHHRTESSPDDIKWLEECRDGTVM